MNLKAFGDVKQEIIEDAVLKDLLERANAEAGKYSDDDDDDESVCKRPRLQEEERVQRWYVVLIVFQVSPSYPWFRV